MILIDKIVNLRQYLDEKRTGGKTVGLVPTMGALHEGHLQLMKESVQRCDLSVCSIFVNPTQFNNSDDLKNYPKQLEKDEELLVNAKCDVLFAPSVDEMYGKLQSTLRIDFGTIETILEGEFRPGHFSGVGVIVSKLLNIVQPDLAFFGQKDLQQLAVIKKLVHELNMRTEIVSVPTVREKNGLAMSSRNQRLTSEQRDVASNLYRVMNLCKESILGGNSIENALKTAQEDLNRFSEIKLEYLSIINSDSMQEVAVFDGEQNLSICIAAHVGSVRLIDNLYLNKIR